MAKHQVVVLNPGHFHAALSLREAHPDLSEEVHVYAPDGEELRAFCDFIRDFNGRPKDPTRWNLHVHAGEDSLEALLRAHAADAGSRETIAILAGRNDVKMAHIERLNRAGFRILADKPWITDADSLPLLEAALGPERPLTLDIMTERFEITTLLQKAFLAAPEVFGEVRVEASRPSVYKESVHHLFKLVNGKALKRPPWYFDVGTQGSGVVDVTTHLVDMTHWMLFPDQSLRGEDLRLRGARCWATPVSLDKYMQITRHAEFPAGSAGRMRGDTLDLFCNGEIAYTVKGVPVQLRVIWDVEAPNGGGDTHRSVILGTRADLEVRQLPQRGYLPEFLIRPHVPAAELYGPVHAVLDQHRARFPGIATEWEGGHWVLNIPKSLRTTHEQHFGEARAEFLAMLASGREPPGQRANLLAKYTLLAQARQLAQSSPAGPLKGWP